MIDDHAIRHEVGSFDAEPYHQLALYKRPHTVELSEFCFHGQYDSLWKAQGHEVAACHNTDLVGLFNELAQLVEFEQPAHDGGGDSAARVAEVLNEHLQLERMVLCAVSLHVPHHFPKPCNALVRVYLGSVEVPVSDVGWRGTTNDHTTSVTNDVTLLISVCLEGVVTLVGLRGAMGRNDRGAQEVEVIKERPDKLVSSLTSRDGAYNRVCWWCLHGSDDGFMGCPVGSFSRAERVVGAIGYFCSIPCQRAWCELRRPADLPLLYITCYANYPDLTKYGLPEKAPPQERLVMLGGDLTIEQFRTYKTPALKKNVQRDAVDYKNRKCAKPFTIKRTTQRLSVVTPAGAVLRPLGSLGQRRPRDSLGQRTWVTRKTLMRKAQRRRPSGAW